MRTCDAAGCFSPHMARGLCEKHYTRLRRSGVPLVPPTPDQRFWAKVDKTETCWLWTAGLNRHGYGQFKLNGRTRTAHRLAYEWLVGEIPEGLHLDHLCRVRHCVNPDHLEPVTCRVNLLRGETLQARNAAKTHCPQGHPYDRLRAGRRVCSICRRDAMRRLRERKRAAA